jgi:hypothetical protein
MAAMPVKWRGRFGLSLYPLRWRDILAIVVLAGCLVLLTIAAHFGYLKGPTPVNFGLGPDWTCTYVSGGEPVCTKSVSGQPKSSD